MDGERLRAGRRDERREQGELLLTPDEVRSCDRLERGEDVGEVESTADIGFRGQVQYQPGEPVTSPEYAAELARRQVVELAPPLQQTKGHVVGDVVASRPDVVGVFQGRQGAPGPESCEGRVADVALETPPGGRARGDDLAVRGDELVHLRRIRIAPTSPATPADGFWREVTG